MAYLPETISGDAQFSVCMNYRYTLSRIWGAQEQGLLVFIMLNPSTATEITNDPTVERCQRRAFQSGYGGLMVVNLFALRSTDPSVLKGHPDPVGPLNDRYIRQVCSIPDATVVCAWGNHGSIRNRANHVVSNLLLHGVKLHVLKLSSKGVPCHPLYLPYELKPQPWNP